MPSPSDRLATGAVMLIDGATGTELERRGVPMLEGAWCGDTTRTHPDDVRAVHLAHIAAGAELIITNTFATSRHLLDSVDYGEHFEAANQRAAELALEARSIAGRPEVLVAGSMSTTTMGKQLPPIETARVNFRDQAAILADAGVDLLMLEMMRDVEQTHAALDGALATGLPVWMGVSCVLKDGVPWLWNETATLAELLPTVADRPIELISVMHTEVAEIPACLDVLAEHWSGPVGVYAHSGIFEPPYWKFIDVISPADYAAACAAWIDRGVQVVGGCCGIGHEHIAELAPLVRKANTRRSAPG